MFAYDSALTSGVLVSLPSSPQAATSIMVATTSTPAATLRASIERTLFDRPRSSPGGMRLQSTSASAQDGSECKLDRSTPGARPTAGRVRHRIDGP